MDASLSRIQDYASQLTQQNLAEEILNRGYMPPCLSIEPLKNGGYRMEEYEAMERDEGKYFLYYAAIKDALLKLLSDENFTRETLEISVVGAGRGRLVEFCIDLCKELEINFKIIAIDANESAVKILNERFKAVEEVVVEHAVTLYPDSKREDLPTTLAPNTIHLCISELLGTFADNEYCMELQSMFSEIILRPQSGFQIPHSWSAFVSPVCCPSAWNFLSTTNRSLEACYAMSLLPWPASQVLSNSRLAWDCQAGNTQEILSCQLSFDISLHCSDNIDWQSLSTSPNQQPDTSNFTSKQGKNGAFVAPSHRNETQGSVSLHGVVGHFTSNLFGEIQIDTRPWSQRRNSFHWESFFFPIENPIDIPENNSEHFELLLILKRIYTAATRSLWYEWQVISSSGTPISKIHNENGRHQKWNL